MAHYASVGDEIKLANDNWQRNYNMFHNIDIRFRRTLRQQMEKLYLNELSKQVIGVIRNIYTSDYLQSHNNSDINEELNRNINCYKGFIPFPEIKFSINIKLASGETHEKYVKIFEHDGMILGLDIEIEQQTYFVQFFKTEHLDDTKVIETIQSAVNIAVASIDFAQERLLS